MWILYLILFCIALFIVSMVIAFAIFAIQYLFVALIALAGITLVVVLVYNIIKLIREVINKNFFRPNSVYTAPKCSTTDGYVYANTESQILTESYNEFCDNYNTIHLYEAHVDFFKSKINRTNNAKNKELLSNELSAFIADNKAAVSKAKDNQHVYFASTYSEELSNRFYKVQDYLFETSIDAAGKRKKARELKSVLTEFFGDSTSLIITGKRGCVILLPEYIVIKRYNSSPFICKLYEDDILNVVLQKEVLYKESIHSNRKDTVKTVWKHSKLDGSKDGRYTKDNPSTQYIDIADCIFRYNTGFETIKRSCPFERYRDGQDFKLIWRKFISENIRFVQANGNPLNIKPSDNSVLEEGHDAVEDAMLLPNYRHNAENIPVTSPYYRKRVSN